MSLKKNLWRCHTLRCIFFMKSASFLPFLDVHHKFANKSGVLVLCKPQCSAPARVELCPETSVDQRGWQGPRSFPLKWVLTANARALDLRQLLPHITALSGDIWRTLHRGGSTHFRESQPSLILSSLWYKKKKRERERVGTQDRRL